MTNLFKYIFIQITFRITKNHSSIEMIRLVYAELHHWSSIDHLRNVDSGETWRFAYKEIDVVWGTSHLFSSCLTAFNEDFSRALVVMVELCLMLTQFKIAVLIYIVVFTMVFQISILFTYFLETFWRGQNESDHFYKTHTHFALIDPALKYVPAFSNALR